nr:Chain C, Crystal structure of the SmcHead bound to the C-winged helix domain of ScpA [Pyrococcus furiosus DSM 3638]4I99_D Chain D, Crystal structure of the SmcHead bound to the C-winged helix domain of ScpA [Pyrococcus furiosus DSM 3638]
KKVEIDEEIFVIDDFRVDIEKYVEELYKVVKKIYEKTGTPIKFWDLVPDVEPKIIARTFLYLLFLENMGRVEIIQEEPFGEILVVPM